MKAGTVHETRRHGIGTMVWNIYSLNPACSKLITVWTVVQTVLTATFNSYGDRQISTPPPKKKSIPLNRSIKNEHSWLGYVHETTLYTKFGTNTHTGGLWENGWNITKIIFFYFYFFFSDSRTGQTRGWIFMRDSSKDVKSHKDMPF